MNIFSTKGVKVRFISPNNGYKHHIETAAYYLMIGDIYTIESTDVGAYHTSIYLQEIPGVAFNSVMFENVE